MTLEGLLALLAVAVTSGTPLIFAGLGELVTERSGILNLGVEGMMLAGAVMGFAVAVGTHSAWMGVAIAMLAGAVLALGHAVLAVTLRAGSGCAGPTRPVVRLEECEPERTGDREFRVLLSEGLTITQFAGLIPPGRAPAHHHTYDEVVHVLAGRGVVHLSGTTAEIGPGTSIYLPPYQPHCLENTGSGPLEVLGVFYPAGSPAAKQAS